MGDHYYIIILMLRIKPKVANNANKKISIGNNQLGIMILHI